MRGKSLSGQSSLIARLGLAAVFFYAGVSAVLQPADWIGFIPNSLASLVPFSRELTLQLHSYFEIVLGIIILIGWQRKLLGIIAALDLTAILVLNGINAVTFRDLGLIALALTLIF